MRDRIMCKIWRYFVVAVVAESLNKVNSSIYVVHFPCKTALRNLYVSKREWGLLSSTDAVDKCQSLGSGTYRTLITTADTNQLCLQTYLSHIANFTTGPQTVWVNPSSTTCHPMLSPCPSKARVICVGTLTVGTMLCAEMTVTNGIAVTPSVRGFPAQVLYLCNPGYVLEGVNIRNCQHDGQWDGVAPTCRAYTCPTPTIGNGTVTGAMPVFTASCNQYYTLVGSSTITCTNNTNTTTLPQCELFSCMAPMLSHGTVTGTGPVFIASCNQYYNLVGNSTIACTNNINTTNLPICHLFSCKPGTLDNGNLTGSGLVFTATCNMLYQLVGNSTVGCRSHNTTSPLPLCQPFNCNTPSIEHGTFNGTAPIWNAVCDIGYKLKGNTTVNCYADNTSTSLPECKQTVCNSSTAIENGYVVEEQSALQDEMVSLKCRQGFQLVGDGQAVCQANGSWSHNTFCRAVPCGAVMVIDHGSVVVGKVPPTVGTRATFICNDGFHLRGNRTSVCQTTGNWSVADRSCEDTEKVIGTDSCGSTNTIYISIIVVLALLWVITIVALIIVYRRHQYTVRSELDTNSSTAIQNESHQAIRTAVDSKPPKPTKYATIGDADTAEVTNQGDESGDLATDEKNTYSFIHPTDAPNKRMASTAQQPPPICQPLEDHYNTVEDVHPAMTTSSKAADTGCDAYTVVDHGQDTPLEAAWEASDTACLYADVHPADVCTHRKASQPTVSGFAASPTDAQLRTAINMNTTYPEPTAPAASDSYAMVDLKKKKDRN